MEAIQERFSIALYHTARSWRQALDRRLKDLGLSQTGWLAIATIARAAGPLSQSELAYKVNIENSSCVSLVDGLVKSGLVQRVPSQQDRRVKHVALTEAGLALHSQLKQTARGFREEMLEGVESALLQQMAELLETLQKKADAA